MLKELMWIIIGAILFYLASKIYVFRNKKAFEKFRKNYYLGVDKAGKDHSCRTDDLITKLKKKRNKLKKELRRRKK